MSGLQEFSVSSAAWKTSHCSSVDAAYLDNRTQIRVSTTRMTDLRNPPVHIPSATGWPWKALLRSRIGSQVQRSTVQLSSLYQHFQRKLSSYGPYD